MPCGMRTEYPCSHSIDRRSLGEGSLRRYVRYLWRQDRAGPQATSPLGPHWHNV